MNNIIQPTPDGEAYIDVVWEMLRDNRTKKKKSKIYYLICVDDYYEPDDSILTSRIAVFETLNMAITFCKFWNKPDLLQYSPKFTKLIEDQKKHQEKRGEAMTRLQQAKARLRELQKKNKPKDPDNPNEDDNKSN